MCSGGLDQVPHESVRCITGTLHHQIVRGIDALTISSDENA
jgi:hypothetical protein